jgi:hypothetical protein
VTRSGERGWIAVLAGAALLAVSCSGGADDLVSGSFGRDGGVAADAPFTAIIANSPPGVGPNRLAIALSDGGALLSDATVDARLYWLGDQSDSEASPELRGEMPLIPRTLVSSTDHKHDDGALHEHLAALATVYVARVEFDAVGWWGVALDVEREGERYEELQARFWVSEDSNEPGIGDPVPRSEQQTLRDVDDISQIDSSSPPNPALHALTVAEALETGKPVVVAFVTPAFCQTRFCGPVLENVVTPAWEAYGERVEFLHIEPFDLAEARTGTLRPVPAVVEWGLISEPFVFVLNPDGTVAAKFEGVMETEEITTTLDAILEGS